ncbi:hypothetical protein I545_6380 [Mycobacterium kansasii 662]|uniref:Uncharacterized protein n=1 Tax=Mycobacterium kansasii 662 TaxID=1299326 RepID=X7YNE2_MYCKA|nr:hypothetical protein I545_6380 [Mycobacterium kansasii 662]
MTQTLWARQAIPHAKHNLARLAGAAIFLDRTTSRRARRLRSARRADRQPPYHRLNGTRDCVTGER